MTKDWYERPASGVALLLLIVGPAWLAFFHWHGLSRMENSHVGLADLAVWHAYKSAQWQLVVVCIIVSVICGVALLFSFSKITLIITELSMLAIGPIASMANAIFIFPKYFTASIDSNYVANSFGRAIGINIPILAVFLYLIFSKKIREGFAETARGS